MKFNDFKLHPSVEAGVKAAGYVDPTPIQREAIPVVLDGKDVMGLAQTGTGKTAAFMLPILHRLMDGPRGVVRALVIAPTRELAEQIYESTRQLGKQTKLKSTTIYGGVKMNPQLKKLSEGVEIVIACPGRLLDHMERGTIDLSCLEVLVLDEADRMFDMGFLPDLRRILRKLPPQRQNLLFSATMPSEIKRLAADLLSEPVTVQVELTAAATTVKHVLYPVEHHLKTRLLLELLKHVDTESVLIFTRTKHRAKKLADDIVRAGHSATCLQGNMTQGKRMAALSGFRKSEFRIMVATDIAARGIDVSQISHVINYDMPDTVDAYTHRIGRTGRAAKTGDAFTFMSSEDRAMVEAIEKALGYKIDRKQIEGFDYRVAAKLHEVDFARSKPAPKGAGAGFVGTLSFKPRRRR